MHGRLFRERGFLCPGAGRRADHPLRGPGLAAVRAEKGVWHVSISQRCSPCGFFSVQTFSKSSGKKRGRFRREVHRKRSWVKSALVRNLGSAVNLRFGARCYVPPGEHVQNPGVRWADGTTMEALCTNGRVPNPLLCTNGTISSDVDPSLEACVGRALAIQETRARLSAIDGRRKVCKPRSCEARSTLANPVFLNKGGQLN